MAAIFQGNTGVIDNKTYAHLYNKTFDEVVKVAESTTREGRQFVATRDTNLDTHTEAEVFSSLSLPLKNEDTDRIPLLTPVEGYSKTFTNVQYRAGILVSARAVRAQKHNLISQMITGLPNTAIRKEEYAIASLFNTGFTTATTGDGQYIFDTDHTFEDPEAGTWDNDPTGASFTTDSLFVAWKHFQNWTNEKGFIDPQPLSEIVYPVALYEDVMKVMNSEKYPQNSLNAKNPFEGVAKTTLYHYLTSTTAWFAIGKNAEMDRGLLCVWQERPNYQPISDSMNPDIILGRRLKMIFSVGAMHSRNLLGNDGV